MRAVCLVAHPDDCAIFAWPFIEAHSDITWTIVYLTYTPWQPRAKEINAYWAKRNIPCIFLGFDDVWESVKNNELGFNEEQAARELTNIAADFDLILTHFEDGDYGHVHHKFVNSCANKTAVPKVYFASTFNYNTEYRVKESVALEELPLHKEVILGFQDRDRGLYIETQEAKSLLKRNDENFNIRK